MCNRASNMRACKLGALPLAEGEGVRSTLLQGHASADEREAPEIIEKNLRTTEIRQNSSQINDLENEPEHVRRLPGRMIFDTTRLHKT